MVFSSDFGNRYLHNYLELDNALGVNIKPFLRSLGIGAKDMVEVYGGIFNIKAEEAMNKES